MTSRPELYDALMLGDIVAAARSRVADLRQHRAEWERAAADAPRALDFTAALSTPRLAVIAEVKRRSPSAGAIAPDLDPGALAAAYETGGAAAVSVLTEPEHFGGTLDDLTSVRDAVEIPVLRKDFVVDDVQLLEARAVGADAILLIAAILSQVELVALVARCGDLGLHTLVEAHTADEVRRAVDAGAAVIGVNNRDLRTFRVDLGTAERLRPLIPDGVVAVAESGVASAADAQRMAAAGFDAVLVGQAAASAADPGAFVADLARTS